MIRKTLLAAAFVLLLTPLGAQDLKSLPTAPETSTSELPNGITCYITTNKESKGFANFALVQKPEADRHASVEKARKCLVSLPHFGSRRPCDFLSLQGIGYTTRGYVNYQSNATVYDFRRVPMTSQAVADSMLLMLFDIAQQSPSPQALIVSGDVDQAKFLDRIRMFSMTVSKREGKWEQDEYKWQPTSEPNCYFTGNTSSELATIRVSYAGPRTPRASMNTLQPVVSKQYASYLGTIIENRIRADFRAQDIPLAEVRFRYYDSASGPGDEQYTISVITSAKKYDAAVRRVATILADLDVRGAGEAELQAAKDRFSNEAARDLGSTHLTNEEYVRRCISAYLYNATLASDKTLSDFFKTGRIPISKELELFNKFAAALLDKSANLTIGFDTPRALMRADLADTFADAWRSVEADDPAAPTKPGFPDSLSLYTPGNKDRVKIKTEAQDPVSGGSIWTFTNGMKVIYRKTADKGMFHYSMMLRGGAGLVMFLKPGESAFVSDMLSNSEISGLRPEEFSTMMMQNGITLVPECSLSNLRIEGTAPAAKLQMVLRSLLSIADERRPDPSAFEYYKKCEALRIELARKSISGVTEHMDSLLSPDYRYPSYKMISACSDDLPSRAEKFFSEQFSRCQDGVLVIMGDLEPEVLKRELCNHLGGFGTSRVYDARPKISRQTIVGSSTYSVNSRTSGIGDGTQGVHVAVSAPFSYNMVNNMSLKVAQIAIQQELSRAMASVGAWAEVETKLELFPDERMSMYIHSAASDENGLPEGVDYAEPYDILSAIREALAKLSKDPLTPAQLAACKEELLIRTEASLASDIGRMDAVLMRYGEGKDIVTDYKAGIDAVSAQSVAAVIEAFKSGGRIETVML